MTGANTATALSFKADRPIQRTWREMSQFRRLRAAKSDPLTQHKGELLQIWSQNISPLLRPKPRFLILRLQLRPTQRRSLAIAAQRALWPAPSRGSYDGALDAKCTTRCATTTRIAWSEVPVRPGFQNRDPYATFDMPQRPFARHFVFFLAQGEIARINEPR